MAAGFTDFETQTLVSSHSNAKVMKSEKLHMLIQPHACLLIKYLGLMDYAFS